MEQKKQYTVDDYCGMIARSILSGNNSCGTLQSAVATGDAKYFKKAAEGVVRVLVRERDENARQLAPMAQKGTDAERVLEFIAQNLGGAVTITEPFILNELERAVGRRLS